MKALSIALLVLVSSAGTFVGLLVCSLLGLGFGFGRLSRDLAKCLGLSLTIVLIGVGLYGIAPNPRVLIVLPLLWFIGIRLAWMDLEKPEIVITGILTLAFTGVVLRVLVAVLG